MRPERSGTPPAAPWARPGRTAVAAAGIVSALLFVLMALHATPLQPSIPLLQFCFSEACFNEVLAQWQAAGIERFKEHFWIDFPFLVSYGIFGHLLARQRFGVPSPLATGRWRLALALPLAAVLDAAENALHLGFVHAPAAFPELSYAVAGVLATGKWLLIVAFVIGGVRALWRRRAGR